MWKIYSLCRIKKYKLDNVKLVVSKNEKLPIIIVVRLGRSMIINNNNFILLEIVKVETDLNDPLPVLNSFNLG